MKSNQDNNWTIPQRQAGAGLLVIIYKAIVTVVKVIWPLLLVFIFRERNATFDTFKMLLIGIPAFILIRSLIDFYFFRFYILGDDLIIKRGFLSRKVITIPLNKIQSVQIEQNLMHQALNVAKLAIDTAGSEKAEAEIDAISISKAESFKEFLLHTEKDLPETQENAGRQIEVPLIRLSTGDLLKLGLSANHLRTFFIVLAFGISAVNDLSDIFGNRVIEAVQESSSGIGITLASVLTLIILVLIVSVIVSVIRILLTYSNFNCDETEQGFRIRTGLINARQKLVPFSKVQFISWEANWLRRLIGLFMLEFHQAQNEKAKRKQRIRVPVTKAEYVHKLLHYYHPAVKPIAHSEHTIHRVYPFRRMLVAGLPMAAVATTATYFYLHEYAFCFLLLVPYVYFINTIYQRKFRLYISPEAFQVNSGAWGRESKIAQWYKIQNLELNQSIYQRRKSLATIIIRTAGGEITIPYINLELANMMKNYALYKVEVSNRSWI